MTGEPTAGGDIKSNCKLSRLPLLKSHQITRHGEPRTRPQTRAIGWKSSNPSQRESIGGFAMAVITGLLTRSAGQAGRC